MLYKPTSSEQDDLPTLPVDAFGIVWTVNAETPSLAWIINAASGLLNWDMLAAAKSKNDAVAKLHALVEGWHRRKAQREKNARRPKEEQQNPFLFEGPDDPDKAKFESFEWQWAQSAGEDLRHHMEVNHWLHRALLVSPEIALKTTFKGLRVIHTLPRVYEHATKPITAADCADAQKDYQDILGDACAVRDEKSAGNTPLDPERGAIESDGGKYELGPGRRVKRGGIAELSKKEFKIFEAIKYRESVPLCDLMRPSHDDAVWTGERFNPEDKSKVTKIQKAISRLNNKLSDGGVRISLKVTLPDLLIEYS